MAIPNYTDRTLHTNGVIDSASFEISTDDTAHLMHLLRSAIYSDRILAVLREYATNAWDAHVDADKAELPIKIMLPTHGDSTLTIRDYGLGLSHEQVRTVYTRYGKSTKRDDAKSVGMLGIGSKSAFAYTDTFTIASFHGGKRRVYIAALDESNRGAMNLVSELDCGDETGVEIKVAVKPDDIDDFVAKAERLYAHFKPQPVINIELPAAPARRMELTSGTIDNIDYTDSPTSSWMAVMGCVPYAIRLGNLALAPEHECLKRMTGVLRFPVNALQITASREELDYSARTKNLLVERFTALVDEYVIDTLKTLEAGNLTPFAQRLEIRQLNRMGFAVPSEWESLAKSTVRVFDDADKSQLYFVRDGSVTNSLMVSGDLKIFIDDTGKNLKGYSVHDLTGSGYVVRRAHKRVKPLTDVERTAVETQLAADLAACQLTGVPVVLLSSLDWDETRIKRKSRGGGTGPTSLSTMKRRVTVFEYNGGLDKQRPSDNWDIVEEHEPNDDDVFVIISGYKVKDHGDGRYDHDDWTHRRQNDQLIAKQMGVEFPTILGYKSSESKPVIKRDVTGMIYGDWRTDFYAALDTEENRALVREWHWTQVFSLSHLPSPNELTALARKLGDDHAIVKTMQRAREAHKVAGSKQNALTELAQQFGMRNTDDAATCEPRAVYERLMDRYVLLSQHGYYGPWRNLYEGGPKLRKAWLQYIRAIDAQLGDEDEFVDDLIPAVKPALALVP